MQKLPAIGALYTLFWCTIIAGMHSKPSTQGGKKTNTDVQLSKTYQEVRSLHKQLSAVQIYLEKQEKQLKRIVETQESLVALLAAQTRTIEHLWHTKPSTRAHFLRQSSLEILCPRPIKPPPSPGSPNHLPEQPEEPYCLGHGSPNHPPLEGNW